MSQLDIPRAVSFEKYAERGRVYLIEFDIQHVTPLKAHDTIEALKDVGVYAIGTLSTLAGSVKVVGDISEELEKERQATVKKLSYHTGIPTQDLQAYLDSKDEVKEFSDPQPNKEISNE